MTRFVLVSVIAFAALPITGVEAAELTGRVVAPDPSAIVWIAGAPAESLPPRDTVIAHTKGGSFEPALSVGIVGGNFIFRNEDDTLHTTHLYLHLAGHDKDSARPLVNGATVYNIALPHTGMEVERPILAYHEYRAETGPIEVKCNVHPDESAQLLVFGHPFATVTGEGGSFTIENVPAGRYDVWVWHGGEARMWSAVEFAEGGSVEKTIEIEDMK